MTEPTPQTRRLDSWLAGFMEYTDGVSSPKIFRRWAGLTALGAALERRVWVRTAKGQTYANMFVLLLGPPGLGKSEAIQNIRAIVKATSVKDLHDPVTELMPYDVTKAALYDKLAGYTRWGYDPMAWNLDKKEKIKYHSAFLAVSELGDLIREYDSQLLSALHSMFDCPPVVEEERRYKKNDPISIQNPSLALLGGSTVAYLTRCFPPQAWDEGFMARTIMVYSAEGLDPDLFTETSTDMLLLGDLVADLRQLRKLNGEMKFTDNAKEAIRAWQRAGRPPEPEHHKLLHYNTRRLRHVLKLSMISAVDKGNVLIVDVEDFQQALAWLLDAEKYMPQVFLEIVGRSDGQVINELYFHVKQITESPLHGNKPVRKALLVDFLRHRVSSWQVEQVLNTAVEAELLILCPMGDGSGEVRYKPAPKPSLLRAKKK